MITDLGAVHECNVAEYGPDVLELELLKVGEGHSEFQGVDVTNVWHDSSVEE